MSAMREKDAADYDLERFVEMFDLALTSDDPRVKNALRQLMMMVILTDTSDHEAKQRVKHGPLRRMNEEIRDIYRSLSSLRDEFEQYKRDNNRQTAMEIMANRKSGWPHKPEDFNLTQQELNDIQMRISNKLTGGKN